LNYMAVGNTCNANLTEWSDGVTDQVAGV